MRCKDKGALWCRFLYLEWLTPILDYFVTIKLKEFLFDSIVPLIIAIALTNIYNARELCTTAISSLSEMMPNILAILIGFTISAITIVSGGSYGENNGIQDGSSFKRQIIGEPISPRQFLLLTMIFALLQQIFALLFVFFIKFIGPLVDITKYSFIVLMVYCYSILSIMAIITRITVWIYFVNFKNGK